MRQRKAHQLPPTPTQPLNQRRQAHVELEKSVPVSEVEEQNRYERRTDNVSVNAGWPAEEGSGYADAKKRPLHEDTANTEEKNHR